MGQWSILIGGVASEVAGARTIEATRGINAMASKVSGILVALLALSLPTALTACHDFTISMHDSYGDGWNQVRDMIRLGCEHAPSLPAIPCREPSAVHRPLLYPPHHTSE